MENDFLERKLTRIHGPQGKEMMTRMEPLWIIRQCSILDISRSSAYRKPTGVNAGDVGLMHKFDALHLRHPFKGSLNRPQLARHLSVIQNDYGRGDYEQKAIPR